MPLWVADMDFATPDFILNAVRERLAHPVVGYTEAPLALIAAFVDWAERRYAWKIHPDWVIAFTSLVPGLNAAVRAIGQDGDGSLVMTPIYPPFLKTAEVNRRQQVLSPLILDHDKWVMDLEDLREKASDPSVGTLMFSNPQNPTGRIYTHNELASLAELCLRTDTVMISDEIHWGLCLDTAHPHIPIATLSEEISDQTITLISHTKSYNIAGLQSAFAVISNPAIRQQFEDAKSGWMASVSPLAYAAAIAAYNDETTWLAELNEYLAANRDLLETCVAELDNIHMTHVEGTHLGWLNARAIPVDDTAAYFEAHGLGLSAGEEFDLPGFVRFNFATPRSLLNRALARLETASVCAH